MKSSVADDATCKRMLAAPHRSTLVRIIINHQLHCLWPNNTRRVTWGGLLPDHNPGYPAAASSSQRRALRITSADTIFCAARVVHWVADGQRRLCSFL